MTQLDRKMLTETPEEIHASLERLERDVLFVWNRISEWRRLYMNQWIAVHDEKLLATSHDLDDLNCMLAGLDIPRGKIYVEIIKPSYDMVPSSFGVVG